MPEEVHVPPKFPWDYDVPKNAFWNDLNYSVGRNFLQCYTESEISKLQFDESLSHDDKLEYLVKTLDKTLAEKETKSAPKPFKDVDYIAWRNILLGLSTIEHYMGNFAMEEEITRERYENGPGGSKDLSALHELSMIMEATGRYVEGESMAREVLLWMDSHDSLGKYSPQAISTVRIITSCVWKQKKFDKGQEWIKECSSRVEGLGESKFAKYIEAEKQQVDDLVKELEEWRKKHGGLE